MIQPQQGTWYIVVTCDKCKSTIFLFPDLTKGKGFLDANYIVTCPRCNHKGGYQARHYFHSAPNRRRRTAGNLVAPSLTQFGIAIAKCIA